jgi:DNA polymerase
MTILWIDFETRSRRDLPNCGVYNYVQDRSTEVLCMSYAFDDGDVSTWIQSEPFPDTVRNYSGMIYAHNAAFERLVFWYVLQINFKLEQFYCTATQARANCAPGGLEDAGRFAGASMRKDHRGAQLIRLLSIPRHDGTFNEDPQLMKEMVEYCEQDVKVMRAVSQSMRPLSDEELADYHVNERINDRGVKVDVPLCFAAMQYAAKEQDDIQQIVRDVTNNEITSVRSPKMREWVAARLGSEALKLMRVYKDGEPKQSIDKSVRANLLAIDDPEQVPPDVKEVIQCADDLWASSVAKFERLSNLADDEDERVRGAFVFAGGAATGRASSYGAQVHNFTRKVAKDPEATRQAMVRGHELIPNHGKRITDVLRGMLRPALIPEKGNVFVVADWRAIEARMNPWLSNEPDADAVLDVFRSGRDIYMKEAAGIYKVSEDQVTPDQRFIGKVASLACFAADTLVLTDNGAKYIVDVSLKDKLWDGQEWVTHQGVINKGLQQTINVCGMSVTGDHLLLVKQKWKEAKTVLSSKNTLTLALVTGSVNLPFLATKLLKTGRVGQESSKFNVLVALNRIQCIYITLLKALQRDAPLVQKKRQVFGEKNTSNMLPYAQMIHIEEGYLTDCPHVKIDATIQKQENMKIMEREEFIYTNLGAQIKQHFYAMYLHLKGGINQSWTWIELTWIKGMSLITCDLLQENKMQTTNDQFEKCKDTSQNLKPVFDILNSGSRNRFTVITKKGALIAHNCGYGGGLGAFTAMGRGYGLVMQESDAKRTVNAWRRANVWAVRYWQNLETAYTRAMRNKGKEFSAGRVTYMFDGQHLWYALPSGRILCYPFAKLEEEGITYAKASWKPEAKATEWPRARLWKGLAAENICQAAANDVLRTTLRQFSDCVLHVHDEVVIECNERAAEERKEALRQVMVTAPAWADGLPLDVEIKIMSRYGK